MSSETNKQLSLPFESTFSRPTAWTQPTTDGKVYSHFPIPQDGLYVEASDVIFGGEKFEVEPNYEDFVVSKLSGPSQDIETLVKRLYELEKETHVPRFLAGVGGLCGESGEVGDYAKKVVFQGKPFNKEKIIDELGDVLFYIQAIMSACGTTFDEVIQKNREKLNNRYPQGFSIDRSEKRE